MKDDQLLLSTQDIPKLIENIDELISEIRVINLANTAVLHRFDTMLDTLTSLDLDVQYFSSPDWNFDASTVYVLRQIAKKVIESAKMAKTLLRKAALKSYGKSGDERLLLGKISVLLIDIKLSLIQINSELFGIKSLSLFDFTNSILR